MSLFQWNSFTSHSGKRLQWKIDCDSLSDDDIRTIANIISSHFKFSEVVGIPRGGIRLAEILQNHVTPNNPYRLIVDDVLTTGDSMNAERRDENDIGIVIFARSTCPDWVFPVFQLMNPFN